MTWQAHYRAGLMLVFAFTFAAGTVTGAAASRPDYTTNERLMLGAVAVALLIGVRDIAQTLWHRAPLACAPAPATRKKEKP